MSKRERQREAAPGARSGGGGTPDTRAWIARAAILAGIGVLIYMNGAVLRQARESRTDLGDRLGQVEARVAQLGTKVDAAARSTPPRSGPDPDKVYTVRTEGSPAEGPASAPVVIAEFSDFQ
ncbi:MAG: hypothetical protein LAO51_05950 [Acidobacteriia bacterium]|nr:hypothetical protein [Terriglobia bacterium]